MGNHFNTSVMQVVYDGYLWNGYDDTGSWSWRNSMNYEIYSLHNKINFTQTVNLLIILWLISPISMIHSHTYLVIHFVMITELCLHDNRRPYFVRILFLGWKFGSFASNTSVSLTQIVFIAFFVRFCKQHCELLIKISISFISIMCWKVFGALIFGCNKTYACYSFFCEYWVPIYMFVCKNASII